MNLRALRTLKREATLLLAERSRALTRVADDGWAFKALRPHPHAGQAGGSFGGARDTPSKNTEYRKIGS
jgi:hypothetical protein